MSLNVCIVSFGQGFKYKYMQAALAHSGGHLLSDHLTAVAQLAQVFGSEAVPNGTNSQWAYLAGLWHDLGKYRPGFQRYLRASDDSNSHIEGKVAGRDKTHSAAGALWAIETLGAQHGERGKLAARVLAYVIAGHHAGLDGARCQAAAVCAVHARPCGC